MNKSKTLIPVNFQNDVIYTVEYDGQPFAPVKPIVENLGLAWSPQAAKLRGNKRRWGMTIIVTPSQSGNQKTVCIPVRKLFGFLATINPSRVKKELRPKIIAYQNECDDVLWAYWNNLKKPQTTIPAIDSRQQKNIKKALEQLAQGPAVNIRALDNTMDMIDIIKEKQGALFSAVYETKMAADNLSNALFEIHDAMVHLTLYSKGIYPK